MKAHVFILQGQDALFKEIKALLEDEIYRNIEVERMEIDPKYGQSSGSVMHERCRMYLHLLRASFVASNPFEVVVKNDRETHWCYLGYQAEFGGYCFELKHMQMTALFPAVGIMDRLVMLPEEFHRNLDVYPRTFLSLPKPLNLGGVELVDFHVEGTVKHAVNRVAVQLKREWKNLCHRHMGVHRLFKPDYEELSRLLNVDSLFLKSSNVFSPDVRLDVSVVPGKVVEDALSRVVLELRNEGGRPLRNIRIRVRAPSGALASPVSQTCDLLPPEPVRLELELTPKAAPCCPLEVFIDQGDDPSEIPSYPISVPVDVSPRDRAPR